MGPLPSTISSGQEQYLSGLTSNSSSAEMLIEALNTINDANYLYVTFEPTEGFTIMTGKVISISISMI